MTNRFTSTPTRDVVQPTARLCRRAFVQQGTLVLATTSLWAHELFAADAKPVLRIGLLTDLHYADKTPAGTRHYRETLDKFEEAALEFERAQTDFTVELGDFIDAADSVEVEQRYLKTMNQQFAQACRERHYVLGNHCVDTLTKEEFLAGVEQPRSYYSFERAGFHFVVLDACFRGDGTAYGRKNFQWTDANIPPSELEWLQADLASQSLPVIVFAHQRLDVSNHHGVRNNAEVRKILEASGKVLAVFQGHSHQNDLTELEGIHYCTLKAMVEGSGAENNGYAVLSLDRDHTLRVSGFRKQSSYNFSEGSR